jgi:hypothetical protein
MMRRLKRVLTIGIITGSVFVPGGRLVYAQSGRATPHPQMDRVRGKEEKGRDCLEVCGTATINGRPIRNVTIRLFRGDTLITEIPSTRKEKVYLVMNENCNYTISYAAKGYMTRLIGVDTHLPKKVNLRPVFSFDFELELPVESKDYNPEFTDFPIALISYDHHSHKFEYNKQYTTTIKKGLTDTAQTLSEKPFGK